MEVIRCSAKSLVTVTFHKKAFLPLNCFFNKCYEFPDEPLDVSQ